MFTSRYFSTAVLIVGLLVCGRLFGQAVPNITHVSMDKCEGDYTVYQSETYDGCWLEGPGLVTATGATVSGSGVTAMITERIPISKIGLLPKGKLRVQFTASASASTNERTVTINGPLWSDTFKIRIQPRAKLTGEGVPEPEISFKNNVDVLLKGENIGNIKLLGASAVSPVHDAEGNSIFSNSVNVTAQINNAQTHNDNQVLVRLNFSKELTETRVIIRLWGDENECGAMRAYHETALTRTVTIKAKPSNKNYVKSITFPYGSTVSVGSVATIQINLEQPVPESSGFAWMSMDGTGSSQGAHVMWKIIPANVFEEAPGGTSYNPNGLNTLIIPPGNEFGQITLKVKECPNTRANSSTVKIQTWRLNTNTYQAPEFKEQQFQVSCPVARRR